MIFDVDSLPGKFLLPLLICTLAYLAPKNRLYSQFKAPLPAVVVAFFKTSKFSLPFYPYCSIHFLCYLISYGIALLFVSLNKNILDDSEFPRFGFLALDHFALAILFAIKNSPLTYLGFQYPDLIKIHILFSIAGTLFSLIHGSLYIQEWITSNVLQLAFSSVPVFGADPRFGTAVVCILLLMMSTSIGPVKRFYFRAFKLFHLFGLATIPILLFLHVDISIIYLLPSIMIFFIDGISKAFNLSIPINSAVVSKEGVITRLEINLATRTTSKPGQWYYIYSSAYGAHPLSLIRADENTLYFAAGSEVKFPRSLLISEPTAVDGPYGNSFDTVMEAKNVLLLAGGIGITPILSLALSCAQEKFSKLSVVYIAPSLAMVKAFKTELLDVMDAGIYLTVYVTQETGDDEEGEWIQVLHGRPNLLLLGKEYKGKESLSIAVCGPSTLVSEIETISRVLSDEDGLVYVYSESFNP